MGSLQAIMFNQYSVLFNTCFETQADGTFAKRIEYQGNRYRNTMGSSISKLKTFLK